MSNIEQIVKEERAKMEVLAKEISSNILFYYLIRGPVCFFSFESYCRYYNAQLPAFRLELAYRYHDNRFHEDMTADEAEVLYQEYFDNGVVCSKEEMEPLFFEHMEWLAMHKYAEQDVSE